MRSWSAWNIPTRLLDVALCTLLVALLSLTFGIIGDALFAGLATRYPTTTAAHADVEGLCWLSEPPVRNAVMLAPTAEELAVHGLLLGLVWLGWLNGGRASPLGYVRTVLYWALFIVVMLASWFMLLAARVPAPWAALLAINLVAFLWPVNHVKARGGLLAEQRWLVGLFVVLPAFLFMIGHLDVQQPLAVSLLLNSAKFWGALGRAWLVWRFGGLGLVGAVMAHGLHNYAVLWVNCLQH